MAAPGRKRTKTIGEIAWKHRLNGPWNCQTEKAAEVPPSLLGNSLSASYNEMARNAKAPENRGFFGRTPSVSTESRPGPDWVAVERVLCELVSQISLLAGKKQGIATDLPRPF